MLQWEADIIVEMYYFSQYATWQRNHSKTCLCSMFTFMNRISKPLNEDNLGQGLYWNLVSVTSFDSVFGFIFSCTTWIKPIYKYFHDQLFKMSQHVFSYSIIYFKFQGSGRNRSIVFGKHRFDSLPGFRLYDLLSLFLGSLSSSRRRTQQQFW
jgi:hypothetical protein